MDLKKNIVIAVILVLCCFAYCDGLQNNLCTNASTSQGTKSFVGLIYRRFTSSNMTAKLNKSNFDQLVAKLDIGRTYYRHILSPNAMDREYADKIKTSNVIGGKECYNTDKLFAFHGIDPKMGISHDDFIRICPALVQQVESEVCIKYHKGKGRDAFMTKSVQTWGYGFISITIISLLSLVVIAMIPCLKKSFYAKVMTYLVALAVGTLSGDAMLHLIPHAFGEGSNDAIKLIVSEKEELKQAYAQVWRALFVLLGIYSFFIVEQLMRLRGGGHGHSHGGEKKDQGHSHGHNHGNDSSNHHELDFDDEHKPKKGSVLENKSTATKQGTGNGEVAFDNPDVELTDVTDDMGPTYESGPNNETIAYVAKRKQSLRDPGEKQITSETSIATVAWVVIVGDGFHNFSDGLAIGAAFSASVSSGVSTTIAVFCHELPHELGDFAVLLNAGMTVKQAIFYNLISTVLAYLGLIVGILAGTSEMGRHFILSITAGLFLYISLADLLPELNNEDIPNQSKLCTFLTQNLGIFTGIAIMLVISLYEHAI